MTYNIAVCKEYDSAFTVYEHHFTGMWQYKDKKDSVMPVNYVPQRGRDEGYEMVG